MRVYICMYAEGTACQKVVFYTEAVSLKQKHGDLIKTEKNNLDPNQIDYTNSGINSYIWSLVTLNPFSSVLPTRRQVQKASSVPPV